MLTVKHDSLLLFLPINYSSYMTIAKCTNPDQIVPADEEKCSFVCVQIVAAADKLSCSVVQEGKCKLKDVCFHPGKKTASLSGLEGRL